MNILTLLQPLVRCATLRSAAKRSSRSTLVCDVARQAQKTQHVSCEITVQ